MAGTLFSCVCAFFPVNPTSPPCRYYVMTYKVARRKLKLAVLLNKIHIELIDFESQCMEYYCVFPTQREMGTRGDVRATKNK